MPELPEVEIVKQSLNKKIKGKIINKVLIKNRNLRVKIPRGFAANINLKKIVMVDRFAKYLIIKLKGESFCLIHLGMSGTIHIASIKNQNEISNTSFYQNPYLPKKHNHILLIFDKIKLIYNDPRRFGYFKFIENKKKLIDFINKYGPEPFSSKFNLEYLRKNLKKKEKNIKNFLLDQNFVSGIGNIYASEILYRCKINPLTKAKKLNLKNLQEIIFYSKLILNEAIKKGGSTIRDFRSISGNKGKFQKSFKVYGRENKKCLNLICKGQIVKKIISNRSSFFCNTCQK